jgi:hypothetical protein
MRRLVAFAALVSLVALAGPAPAALPPGWEAPVAGIPSTVNFTSVAQLNGSRVVAVGADTGTRDGVVYRLVGGKWGADTVELPPSVDTQLLDVAIGDEAALAVGWKTVPGPLPVEIPVPGAKAEPADTTGWGVDPGGPDYVNPGTTTTGVNPDAPADSQPTVTPGEPPSLYQEQAPGPDGVEPADVDVDGDNVSVDPAAPTDRLPLLLRFERPPPADGETAISIGEALGKPGGTWKPIDMSDYDAAGGITSIALSGDDAVIGTTSGRMYSLSALSELSEPEPERIEFITPLARPETNSALAPVVGVALESATSGFAVSGATSAQVPTAGEVFEITSEGDAAPDEQNRDDSVEAREAPKRSIAAAGGQAIAIDSKQIWEKGTGENPVWTRHALPASVANEDLLDVTIAPRPEGGPFAVVVGKRANPVLWTRSGSGDWSQPSLVTATTKPLRGVAVERPDSMWAVGDGGTILRFREPDPLKPGGGGITRTPVATNTGTGGGGTTGGTGDSGTGNSTDTSSQTSTESTSTTSTNQQSQTRQEVAPGEKLDVIVDQPRTPPPARPQTPPRKPVQKLVTRVRVSRLGQRALVIKFKLAAPARVAVSARVGRKLVGRRAFRRLKPGRHRVVVRYSGRRLPTALKIVARTGRPRTGGRQ